ncbi:MAG: hypothetical protein M5R36_17795 [Deltaproteobacteria bacterium]|nr:hypothetical protein [Deltaproteobacteria bacterium]
MDWIKDDFLNTLGRYYDPPAYKRAVTCSTMPLDDFSVWADQFIAMYPWLESVVNINPQTADARELDDRHWTDMYWQSTPFEEACNHGEDKTYVGPGMDYLLAYWMGVYYGLLPGDGPYPGEHELEEVDDDDTADDDTDIDDDTADDDADDDWHPPADDDDDVADDDAADDDVGDDDDDDDGCGC